MGLGFRDEDLTFVCVKKARRLRLLGVDGLGFRVSYLED